MKKILLLAGSPKKNGVTDTLANAFICGAKNNGITISHIRLRDFRFRPCMGCGFCESPPYQCLLAGSDDTEEIFELSQNNHMLVTFTPIYFYALPAHFKALVDRAQRFWHKNVNVKPEKPKPAMAFFAAGRPRGKELFTGSTLTLKYFFNCLNFSLTQVHGFRNMENLTSLKISPDILSFVTRMGRISSRKLLITDKN